MLRPAIAPTPKTSQQSNPQANLASPPSEPLAAASAYPCCHITHSRDSWVKLTQPLDDFAHDEALLLCQDSQTRWFAWVPDYGEVMLHRSQFYN